MAADLRKTVMIGEVGQRLRRVFGADDDRAGGVVDDVGEGLLDGGEIVGAGPGLATVRIGPTLAELQPGYRAATAAVAGVVDFAPGERQQPEGALAQGLVEGLLKLALQHGRRDAGRADPEHGCADAEPEREAEGDGPAARVMPRSCSPCRARW